MHLLEGNSSTAEANQQSFRHEFGQEDHQGDRPLLKDSFFLTAAHHLRVLETREPHNYGALVLSSLKVWIYPGIAHGLLQLWVLLWTQSSLKSANRAKKKWNCIQTGDGERRFSTSLGVKLPGLLEANAPYCPVWWRGGEKWNVDGANNNIKPSDTGLCPLPTLAELRPGAYLFCQPWIMLVYLLSTPSTLRACCGFTLFPNTDPRPPPAPAEPPREPEPGLCDPARPSFLDAEFDEEELVLFVPGCGLLSVLSILATGRRRAGEAEEVEGEVRVGGRGRRVGGCRGTRGSNSGDEFNSA